MVTATSIPYSAIFLTPIGKLAVAVHQGMLCKVNRVSEALSCFPPLCPQTTQLVSQLTAYFLNPHQAFDCPVRLLGTEFQKAVWRLIQAIPTGETRTYSDLASALRSSPRAVGNACRANPMLILIPCHRVVAKQGLGGFSGDTTGEKIKVKQWLLSHEQAI